MSCLKRAALCATLGCIGAMLGCGSNDSPSTGSQGGSTSTSQGGSTTSMSQGGSTSMSQGGIGTGGVGGTGGTGAAPGVCKLGSSLVGQCVLQ